MTLLLPQARRGILATVFDRFEILCPWCGELLELDLAPEDLGTLVQDCGVCCNPCEISIRREEWGDAQVTVERAQ